MIPEKKLREAIKTVWLGWKADNITCKCNSCTHVRESIRDRDRLIKLLNEMGYKI